MDIIGLSGEQYDYSFEVVDPNARNSPQTVVITLDVGIHRYVPEDFPTIQQAINEASNADMITVSSGLYNENINFMGKDIVLTSTNPENSNVVATTIIDGGENDSVVTFSGSETSACKLRGFTITNGNAEDGGGINGNGTEASVVNCTIRNNIVSHIGGGLYLCNGTISNCTVVDNTATNSGGGLAMCDGSITNCIIWNNNTTQGSGDQLYSGSMPTYSCIQDWAEGGTGNIITDPLFADTEKGNYHLKSEYGRWDPNSNLWVYDSNTSLCIDAGDPASDWTEELWPHGKRINMLAYGGTPQASMSPNSVGNIANLDHDDAVDANDLGLLSEDWLYAEYLLDTDLNRNGKVDIADFAEFGKQWLWVEP